MMHNTTIRYATLLALAAAFVSGTNIFLTKIAVKAVQDPVLFTSLKNALVAVVLVGLFIAYKKKEEVAKLSKSQWTKLFLIGIIGGSVPFGLYFTGLSMTSAINAGLIHKTLLVWVALLAVPLFGERLTRLQWVGFGAIFASNFFVGGFTGFAFNTGELLILAATVLWAIENIIAKKALSGISSLTVASARMVLGSALLFGYAFMTTGVAPIASVTAVGWGWTALTSVLLLGYVLSWYTALKHAPAMYVAALLVPATLITNVLSAIFVTHAFTWLQAVNAALSVVGVILLVLFAKRTAEQRETNAVKA